MSRYKVYTKTGDQGEASLYNGERRTKNDVVFEALGDTDELNSIIGVAREYCLEAGNALPSQLETIQSSLLDIGSAIATPLDSSPDRKKNRVQFEESQVDKLESWIDEMDEQLDQLTTFILPSGGKAASHLHHARTVCRRAERSVVPLVAEQKTDAVVGRYLNRLSDYLFTAARFAAKKGGFPETTYKKA
uniref:Corrinoid adenosyltransferase MMAB n=1 Tax=Tetraselmis sp. GSL018 TaxID=582737 RepID=A0A061RUF7_9CHLO